MPVRRRRRPIADRAAHLNPVESKLPVVDEVLQHRAIRSFVLREGRITPAQAQALDALWPRYGLGSGDSRPGNDALPAIDAALLFGRKAPLAIEIGFGSGDHLAECAAARPETDFIGIEVHRPGVGRLLQRAQQLGLNNLRVACADAVEVLRVALPAGGVDEAMIFFPDPWPKKRHHKRRLIQTDFARLLARVLRPGGRLRLATDWAEYAAHMREVLDPLAEFENLAGDSGYMTRPDDRPTTRFEARGLRLGHAVFDLEYRRR
ncbi:MAG: tRNA (guanine-N7)-methyltransferase [Nevskia sp.]|nr:tRNA (guanine-N7)-methyltransferase [Nevskia sp.]